MAVPGRQNAQPGDAPGDPPGHDALPPGWDDGRPPASGKPLGPSRAASPPMTGAGQAGALNDPYPSSQGLRISWGLWGTSRLPIGSQWAGRVGGQLAAQVGPHPLAAVLNPHPSPGHCLLHLSSPSSRWACAAIAIIRVSGPSGTSGGVLPDLVHGPVGRPAFYLTPVGVRGDLGLTSSRRTHENAGPPSAPSLACRSRSACVPRPASPLACDSTRLRPQGNGAGAAASRASAASGSREGNLTRVLPCVPTGVRPGRPRTPTQMSGPRGDSSPARFRVRR
jgi:hypothetical protein